MNAWFSALALLLLIFSLPPFFIGLARLLKGPGRRPPIAPQSPIPEDLGTVTVVVPTLNEAARIDPCLAGLTRQGYEVREILVVDSRSTDGTRERVKALQERDPRFRLLTDDPLPPDWVGRPWALNYGFLASSPKSEWVLGIDADTQPQGGLVAGLLRVAQGEGFDLISLSPQFILREAGEWWLQPALLMTLLFRFDPSGSDATVPERVMANGQCFLCRRRVLEAVGGYDCAKGSFCDDVTLAREIAKRGYKVGFLDGQRVIKVRMYEGFGETWREWGRSLDLKDATSRGELWGDLWLLTVMQGLPLPSLLFWGGVVSQGVSSGLIWGVLGLNGLLVLMRFALLWAIAPSYDRSAPTSGRWCFWLSPLADPLAVLRIFLSAQQVPQQWRGRSYHL
ncbi:glycosyltransferase [Spirulina subsalsa FACHB-351]|uniref:Glycosyltransferase n=1 Tax=Spirulina subsalsa FACHB-351 TaxID=234711 RepID=A0ABT3KZZ0_9CYAN|nr:glycosyltransferase family 2 protein [Spirulina subsalsa]MCW6034813.1 glycosyltransferase [Spirulina subsalsa FACHB-351]